MQSDFDRLSSYALPVLALAAVVTLSSCAIPAKLERVHSLGQPNCPFEQRSLHALLELSLESPNRGESAHALGHVVEEWRKVFGSDRMGRVEPDSDSAGEVAYEVRFRAHGEAEFYPDYFEILEPAVDYRIKKLPRFTKDGAGAPMLAHRENTLREPVEIHYPPEGITREITAILHPGRRRGSVQQVEIELLCSLYHEEVTVSGKTAPLAADYSVALASLLSRTKRLKKSEFGDLLTPSPKRDPKLYLMEPYDPDKEILIMIHGLLDSPLGWSELTNELRSVESIRNRFQIWHFLYNTSAPPLYSGRILRTQFREMRKEFDPGGDHLAFDDVTLLSHSMGGLVSRSLITDPGQEFWELGFTRPISSLKLSAEDRASLEEAFLWKPEPAVGRVIFVCVPHRGSHFADNPLGKLGRNIVKPPGEFRAFYTRISEANPGAFTRAYAELGEGKLDSVGSLSPRQPTLQVLADLPVGNHVKFHSIIGDRGKEGPLEKSSDGVVEYWSSHLPEAESEHIVGSDHGALDDPEMIKEVKRILDLP